MFESKQKTKTKQNKKCRISKTRMKLKRRSVYNETVCVSGRCGFLGARNFPLYFISLLNDKRIHLE